MKHRSDPAAGARVTRSRPPVHAQTGLRTAATLVAVLLLGACGQSPSGVREPRVVLEALGDSVIFVSNTLRDSEQLAVAARDADSGSPVVGVEVGWQLVEGAAALTPQSVTSVFGMAAATVSPTQPGTHRVRATTPRMTGPAPVFEIRVVAQPVIVSLQPSTVAAGGEVVITGTDFSETAAHHAVYFSGIRGQVISASATEIRVRVPSCLPARTVNVTVALGSVHSAARSLVTTGGAGTVLALQPGQVQTLSGPALLECLRLPESAAGSAYLIVAHNASSAVSPPMPFELRGLLHGPAAAAVALAGAAPTAPFAESWEAALRVRESDLVGARAPREVWPDAQDAPGPTLQALPSVGEEREFNVLNPSQTFDRVKAVVRRVTQRAVIFVDADAADAFSNDDLAFFGTLFDSTIYPTNVSVFGEPSDIDGNQRIFVLFTPRVNALTPRGESSVITGYFYGCDLLPRRRCSGSNEAEIFYSLVPDPTARWSNARTHTMVRTAVPPILAHEFQHMIHFAKRGMNPDVLWLAEALAHTAEELVGEALQSNDPSLAATFATPNLMRAQRYLQAPRPAGVLAEGGNGTLEMRGAGWLFLRHLRTHHGGTELLRRLTAASTSGVTSVTQQTGRAWPTLVTDFGVALWADRAPGLQGTLEPRYTFGGWDLRASLAALPGGFPLSPAAPGWGDFTVTGSIAPASQDYVLLSAPANTTGAPLNLVFTGARGGPFAPHAADGVRLSVLRVR